MGIDKAKPRKLYVLYQAMCSLSVGGVEVKLPDGYWFLPVFADQNEAKKSSIGGAVVEMDAFEAQENSFAIKGGEKDAGRQNEPATEG